MAGRLALVPEFGEWDDHRDPALPRPRNLYRDLIRNVAVSRGQYTRQSAHSGSSYSHSSGASNSCCSSGSASTTATAESCADDHELTKIARRMVSDGYVRRMVNEFGSGDLDRAPLETWFLELDVHWVLQIHEEHGLRRQLQHKQPASSLQELGDKWIRALTVVAVSVAELFGSTVLEEMPAVARFGKASMAKMLVFVDAIIAALEEEKLRTLVDMYICVASVSYSGASYYRSTARPISLEARRILDEIDSSLSIEEIKLSKAISRTMEEVVTLLEVDDQWAIDILRGRGEVHRNTRLMVDCIMPMVKARGSMRYTEQSDLSFLAYGRQARGHSKKAKFESAFHKVYQAQKFWKVPDPQLRDMLRRTITETVISNYLSYLKKHRELEIHVSSGSSSPDMLKEMIGELFEG